MKYWSNEAIPAIQVSSITQDTTERLLPKSTGAVTAYAVSATSYALLAYMQNYKKEEERDLLDPIQKFLQEQHMYVGGFASSQVRLLVTIAIAANEQCNVDITVRFSCSLTVWTMNTMVLYWCTQFLYECSSISLHSSQKYCCD